MGTHDTPPCSGPSTPEPSMPGPEKAAVDIATPNSLASTSPQPTDRVQGHSFSIPPNLTQTLVEKDAQLNRRQQDLLILASLNDNSTLHWRPSWFQQHPFNQKFWTLHNPPNIVTEKIPNTKYAAKEYYTRRMRRPDDQEPLYIKSWDHWKRYCDMYGVPCDFFCQEQIALMRLGLPRNVKGELIRKHASDHESVSEI